MSEANNNKNGDAGGEKLDASGPVEDSKGLVCRMDGPDNIFPSVKEPTGIGVSGVYSDHLQRDGNDVGFREERFDGRRTEVEVDHDGSFKEKISGSSPQGEKDTLRACRILIRTLNELGGNWEEPVLVNDEVVDCRADCPDDPKKAISIQVVRACIDKAFWGQLNRSNILDERHGVQDLSDRIKLAIEKKADPMKIPVHSRQGMLLALDATLTPGTCFSIIVGDFKERWGSWVAGLGFKAVWLIGPDESLTKRLDE
jgi:hypothetical protein